VAGPHAAARERRERIGRRRERELLRDPVVARREGGLAAEVERLGPDVARRAAEDL